MASSNLKKKIADQGQGAFRPIFRFFRNSIGRRQSLPDDSVRARKQSDLDKKLVFSLSGSRIPSYKQLRYIRRYLSQREAWLLRASFAVIILSLIFIGGRLYYSHLETVPAAGGRYVEGVIGMPQTINPLYAAVSDVDSDISNLVYSSLFRRGINGELQKDLIDDFQLSTDYREYTFTLKQSVKWQEADSLQRQYLNVDDVIFTFNAIVDPKYQSPLRPSFAGVNIIRIDDYNFKFVLEEPYAAFLDLLTFGIMPAELWSQLSPESVRLAGLNLKPIGSGLYRFDNLIRDETSGSIREYNLKPNEKYYGNQPLVNISFRFYAGFEEAISALNNNVINGVSYLPTGMRENVITPRAYNYHRIYLPQLTLIFLNREQNPALADRSVRQALAFAIDRNSIINEDMEGDAYIVNGPILPNNFAYKDDIKKYDYRPDEARTLLSNIGWTLETIDAERLDQAKLRATEIGDKVEDELTEEERGELEAANNILAAGEGEWRSKDGEFLSVRLTTVDRNQNGRVIERVGEYWKKIGVNTITEVVPADRVSSEVLRPRNFEALFYGQVAGADPDPYAFWHSSQAREGGFNIAYFIDDEVDKLLEEARTISDRSERRQKYFQFQDIIAEEVPAIFMYSPIYTYVQDKTIKGFDVRNILSPSDRFVNVSEWYIETGKKLIW